MNSLKTYDAKGQTYYLAGPDVMTVAEQARHNWLQLAYRHQTCKAASGCHWIAASQAARHSCTSGSARPPTAG
jgi:hypothetical protein